MTDQTGAERYFEDQKKDPEYRVAYEAARADLGEIALLIKPSLDALVGRLFRYDPVRASYAPLRSEFTDTEIQRAKQAALSGSHPAPEAG